MNPLTKTFIVLLVIFSIAFTMMTVQFSVRVPNWRDQAEKWKNLAQMTDTFNRNLIAAKVAEATRAAEDQAAWIQAREALEAEKKALQEQLSGASTDLLRERNHLAAKEASLDKLNAELSIAHTIAAKAAEHRETLEKRNIYLEKANLDLNEALNEKIATIIVLEQQSRQQEQAISLLKQERDKMLKQLRLKGSALEDATVTRPVDKITPAGVAGVTPIRGQISEVSGDYASISVGSNDGVEQNMVFIIYNERGYVGDILISDVAPDEAAGTLTVLNQQTRPGDRVVDENSYLAMN